MNTLGHKQRRMLVDMSRIGNGGWPRRWALRSADKSVLASLFARQLISSPDTDARLTSAGYLVAASLKGELG